jgi:VWFA-related protein
MLLAILGTSAALSRAQDPSGAAGQDNPPGEKAQGNPAETQTLNDKTEAKQEVSIQDTGTTFKLRVNLVQVHVIVRDSAGKPVENLRKEDFQLFDNGKLQAINTFGVETARSRKERAEAAAKTQAGEGETAAGGPVSLPERFVALTFDDIHLRMEDAVTVRLAAGRFLDAMSPGDRVGIFSTSGELTQDFTSDKEVLKQKVLGLMPRGRLNKSTTECPDISYYMADQLEKEGLPSTPLDPEPQDFQIVLLETQRCMPRVDPFYPTISAVRRVLDAGEAENRSTFAQLDQVLRILSAKPGERILLLASPGFVLARMTTEASGIVDRANRANVVINTLDARGLCALEPGGDITLPGSDVPAAAGVLTSFRLAEQTEQQFVLMDFAYGTGGTFLHSNDVEGGLKLAGSVPEVSYLLGFSPQNQKMDGKYHAIKVTLTGKQKYAIQARRGYSSPKKPEDPQEIAKQEIQEALFSRDEIDAVPLSLQTQYFKTGDSETRLSVVSHLQLGGMPFRKAEGRNFDDLTVATIVFDENGNFVAGGEKLVKLRLLDATIAKMSLTGFTVKSTFDVKPGKYMIRQVVRDSEGAQMAARNGTVVIPF